MGATVGDWLLKKKLGQGGFGEVLHWMNGVTKQEIATKHIKDADRLSVDQQRKMKDRWIQEYKWTQQFQHLPFLVAGVQLGEDSQEFINELNRKHVLQLPVIVLEYCNGGDVRKLLQRPQNANGLSEQEVRDILRCLRQAVHFLHTQCRICHRDLKPDNIVIHRVSHNRKQYKLTDFGLARPAPDKTIVQSVVGTRHYYAPEVVDTGKYNNKVDYWSMGVIVYELVTGSLPFIPHQKAFNIHVNISKKTRNCIAITEDVEQEERFHFHQQLPIEHHLTKPWEAELVKWLPLALDADYSKRGTLGATDEVQLGAQSNADCTAIFSEVDRLLGIKVLTLFAACSYKRIECEVTPDMTIDQLGAYITRETGLPISSIYLVLPTGHPHKSVTSTTRPIDLFVDEWCDNSEESGNPPVMVYIFSCAPQCEYSAPNPCMTDLVRQFCMNPSEKEPPSWVMERCILDMHYMLSKEQSSIRTLLLGFREYALTLEDEMLNYQLYIKQLEKEKDKCLGAVEQFQTLLEAAKQQQRFQLVNDAEWEANCTKLIATSGEILNLCEKIVEHFESSLRNMRDVVLKRTTEIYKKTMESDIYELLEYRRKYLQRGYTMSRSELYDKVIKYAKKVREFLKDDNVKYMRESLGHVHARFNKVRSSQAISAQKLNDIRVQLLQLQLQMLSPVVPPRQPSIFELNNAMSCMNFNTTHCDSAAASLGAFDSLSTKDIVSQALDISQLMENEINMEQS